MFERIIDYAGGDKTKLDLKVKEKEQKGVPDISWTYCGIHVLIIEYKKWGAIWPEEWRDAMIDNDTEFKKMPFAKREELIPLESNMRKILQQMTMYAYQTRSLAILSWDYNSLAVTIWPQHKAYQYIDDETNPVLGIVSVGGNTNAWPNWPMKSLILAAFLYGLAWTGFRLALGEEEEPTDKAGAKASGRRH